MQGLLEKLAGGSIEAVMDSLLFAPLGMTATLVEQYGHRPPGLVMSYNIDGGGTGPEKARPGNPSYKKIAGGMVSRPADMVRFLQALDRGEILADTTFWQMMQRPFPFADWQAYGWRYGERKEEPSVVFHHGGTTRGFVSLITFDPYNNIYVAVMANYNGFYKQRAGMAYFLMDLVKAKLPPAPLDKSAENN